MCKCIYVSQKYHLNYKCVQIELTEMDVEYELWLIKDCVKCD